VLHAVVIGVAVCVVIGTWVLERRFGLNQRELTDLESPWRTGTMAAPMTVPEASIWMRRGIALETVFPVEIFGGFSAGMSIARARLEFGEPSHIRKVGHETVYTYRRDPADIEIVESRTRGSYAPEYNVYEVRALPRTAMPAAVARLVSKLVTLEPTLSRVWIGSKDERDRPAQSLVLYLRSGRVHAIGRGAEGS
jgi:hypothetical protein